MNSWDFSASRLKVKRAKCHIEELESKLLKWFNSDSFKLGVDKNPNTGNQRFNFTAGESMPEDIPVIIGDAIHNLRSALDFIAIEIVAKAKLNISGVKFPIHQTDRELRNEISKGKIKCASPQAADIILDRIKPYQSANPFIWTLNKLSNTDKHRLLIPTVNRADFSNVPIEYENRVGTFPSYVSLEFTSSLSADIVGNNLTQIQIKDHPKPTLTIFFDESQMPGILKYEVVYLLKVFSQLIVDDYIPMFEAL